MSSAAKRTEHSLHPRPVGSRAAPSSPDPNGGPLGRPREIVRLPAAVDTFLGREEDLRALFNLIEDSRLITLTGPPGIGKSRLGLEFARKLAPRSPDGAALVELAALTDPALIVQALASALSLPELPGQAARDRLVADLRDRALLLVLDNCEHLISPCADLVELLLTQCAQLRVLATSREPLHVAGEQVWQVPPLAMPPQGAVAPDELLGYAATRLFVERGAAVNPPFGLTSPEANAVAEISRRLDGNPLAIALAAARVESLTPSDIVRRLDDRFALLTKGSRSDLPRHQTLEAALDWSHDLLSAPERALLRRLAVFAGAFDLDAVESVCAGGGVEAAHAFELLDRLVAKSLVTADTANSSPARYRLLETIRAYAGRRLVDADESHRLSEAHARFYLELAEEAEPGLTGPLQEALLQRLELERANLRAALEWSLAHGADGWALRLAGALVIFWRVRGNFSEGRDALAEVLSASNGHEPRARAKALWGAGFLTMMAGDPEGAISRTEESLTSFREVGDLQGCARALLILGNCKQHFDDPTALVLLEESAGLAREAGDDWCLSHALGIAGFEYVRRSELPVARRTFEECLEVARRAQDTQGLRLGLLGLGLVAVRQGDYALAEPLLEEGVRLVDHLGEDYGKAEALGYLGRLALGRGDCGRARELLEESLKILTELGHPAVPSRVVLLGIVAHVAGDLPTAHALYGESLLRAVGCDRIRAIQGMGDLAADGGDQSTARRLYEQAAELARAGADEGSLAPALHGLGQLARAAGDDGRARPFHNEALRLRRRIGDAPGIAASLEAVAGLAAAAGRHVHAARLFGAAQALREKGPYARAPWDASRHESDVALVHHALTDAAFEPAWREGRGLSVEEAVTQARKGRRRQRPATSGWPSLTDTEQHVATLVAEGLTNPDIAKRLHISLSTVKSHVSRIFSKVGVARRSELAREVGRRRD